MGMSAAVSKLTEAILPASFITRRRTAREWQGWIERIDGALFEDLSPESSEVKKSLFKRFVTLVEIEAHAKCNRVCSFCPNVVVDRRKNNIVTDSQVLDRLFEQLGSIDYSGQIKFARYSEPLTNIEYLLEQVRAARSKVPKALLAIVTNTDYLKPKVLENLRYAGLNRIYMSLYLRPSEKWSLDLANRYSDRLATKLGLRITSRVTNEYSVRCTFDYEGLELHSACINFDDFGTDRGSLMEQYTQRERVGPCREPFDTFVVDYTGEVMPCCNLRSDFPEHKDFAVGDLSDANQDIFDIYAGRLAGWRRSMVGFGAKSFPCSTCRHREVPAELLDSARTSLNRQLNQIGRTELL